VKSATTGQASGSANKQPVLLPRPPAEPPAAASASQAAAAAAAPSDPSVLFGTNFSRPAPSALTEYDYWVANALQLDREACASEQILVARVALNPPPFVTFSILFNHNHIELSFYCFVKSYQGTSQHTSTAIELLP